MRGSIYYGRLYFACFSLNFWLETNIFNLGAEMKLSSISLFFIMTIILTSCGGGIPSTPQISGSVQSSQIKEPQIGAPYTEITIQEIRTSNCDGTNPTTTISRSLVQEQTTFFEVAVEAGGLIRGTPIPTVLEAELEAKIKTALGSNLGNKFEQSISTVLEVQSGQAWLHKVFWKETKVKGIIDVVYQNGTATLNFEKVIGIELSDRVGEPLVCNGNNASVLPTSTGSHEIPIATLQTEPPPTKSLQSTQASNVVMSQTDLLGQWLYQQPRAPMPNPAGANQVIFAHGDINNTGTCRVKEFKTGEPVQGLGLGSFKLWLITGTAEYIRDTELQLQKGAAAHAGTECPYLQ